MTKRIAKNQMTSENWMKEDDPEEAGHFEHAGPAKLSDRNIKKAKRRLSEDKNGLSSSPFSKFSGFGGDKSPLFSFQVKQPTTTTTSNGNNLAKAASDTETDKSTPAKPFSNTGSLFQAKSVNTMSAVNEHSKSLSDKTESDSISGKSGCVNFEKLKLLNVSFLSWIQEHMNRNMCCDFTPVCLDYVEHIKSLEKSVDVAVPGGAAASDSTPKLPKPPAQPKPDLLSGSTPKNSGEYFQSKPAVGLGFFAKKDSQNAASSPMKPFTFSGVAQNTVSEQKKEDDDENYVPPKSDFQPVSEDGALYSKRCKLFFKKDGTFTDKGVVGTLHIKTLDDRKQLFVRADTSTGLILLNISLSESLPTERLGKNNVLIVCVPNPAVDPEPTSVLLRVKTSEEADDLLENLVKYKSSSQC